MKRFQSNATFARVLRNGNGKCILMVRVEVADLQIIFAVV